MSTAQNVSGVGNGLDETTDMGPAVNENQLKTDLSYVEVGKTRRRELASGGNRLDKGDYQSASSWNLPCSWTSIPDAHRAGKKFLGLSSNHSLAKISKTQLRSPTGLEYGLSSALLLHEGRQ